MEAYPLGVEICARWESRASELARPVVAPPPPHARTPTAYKSPDQPTDASSLPLPNAILRITIGTFQKLRGAERESSMEKQTKPAAHLAALRCARASLLLASLRRPRAPPDRRSSSSVAAECAPLAADRLICAEAAAAAARREAAGHVRLAGSELLLVLAVAPAVLLLLLLLLALL
ncbi:uncharacterized protein LOC133907592 [Phragmites australis]|uniref:uncharacterized protein LOC133907592 n=1 Tax=Phragmites australis TaxID=29695 RepID=UPI002D79CA37|nr:uncharacterized protein LOC133907592 [Phragmites australis]